MELSYILTSDDIHAFSRYCASSRSVRHKKRYTVVPMAFLFAVGLAMIFYPGGMVDRAFAEALIAILPPLVIFAMMCVIGVVVHRKVVAGLYSGESTVSFLPDGIHHGDQDTQAITRWRAISRFVETPSHYFVIYGYQRAVIIPRRALNKEQHAVLKTVVNQNRPDLLKQSD
jgi:hypothetical protein